MNLGKVFELFLRVLIALDNSYPQAVTDLL